MRENDAQDDSDFGSDVGDYLQISPVQTILFGGDPVSVLMRSRAWKTLAWIVVSQHILLQRAEAGSPKEYLQLTRFAFPTSATIAICVDDNASRLKDSECGTIELGSRTAKDGFENEISIRDKFLSWKTDPDAQDWLASMGYDMRDLISIEALRTHGQKADVLLLITSASRGKCREGVSIKLVSNPNGYNQVDKRWLKKYAELWQMPDNIRTALQLFVGENKPIARTRDRRRTFLDELPADTQQAVVEFFSINKQKIANELFVGEGDLAARWFMVIQRTSAHLEDGEPSPTDLRSILVPAVDAAQFFSSGDVVITQNGSLRIGRITMQRKGGDNGRESAKMLQFKINPADLFEGIQ